MFLLQQTEAFSEWLESLRDARAKARIAERLRRLALGLRGDARSVGDGVFELRIDYGPGYRVYCVEQGPTLVIILAGGDKSSQARDIVKARKIREDL